MNRSDVIMGQIHFTDRESGQIRDGSHWNLCQLIVGKIENLKSLVEEEILSQRSEIVVPQVDHSQADDELKDLSRNLCD